MIEPTLEVVHSTVAKRSALSGGGGLWVEKMSQWTRMHLACAESHLVSQNTLLPPRELQVL